MNAKRHQGGEGLQDLGTDEANAMLTRGSGEDGAGRNGRCAGLRQVAGRRQPDHQTG